MTKISINVQRKDKCGIFIIIKHYTTLKVNTLQLHTTWMNFTKNTEWKTPYTKYYTLYDFFYFTFIIGRLMHKARSQGNGPLKGERTGCAGGEGSKVVAVFYFLTNTECSWRSFLNILNFTFEMDCVYPKRSLWWLSNKKSNVHFTCYVINALRAVIVTAIIISVILCIQ